MAQLPNRTSGVVAMSTREIAKLTGKQHKHVLRDARAMLVQLWDGHDPFADGPNLDHQSFQNVTWRRDARGYITTIYLPKRETLVLVSGYDVKLRAKIIDRLEALERELRATITRPESKDIRKGFASTLQKHGVRGSGYRDCTNATYIQLTGKDADGLREQFGVKRNLRDAFDLKTRVAVAAAELASTKKIEDDRSWGNAECADACAHASRQVAQLIGGRNGLLAKEAA